MIPEHTHVKIHAYVINHVDSYDGTKLTLQFPVCATTVLIFTVQTLY